VDLLNGRLLLRELTLACELLFTVRLLLLDAALFFE
jgi:hypothetical protein